MTKKGPRPWLAWLALCALICVLRLPSLLSEHVIDDEGMYTAVAVELAHGGLPYVDAVERKPPLLLWTYAGVLRVLGDYNLRGLHGVAALWLLASMYLLYRVARRLWDEAAGLSAALLYGIFVPWATYTNLAWNGEMLMNLPTIGALLLILPERRAVPPVRLFAAGALIATAALFKQPAAISIVPLAIYPWFPSASREDGATGVPAKRGPRQVAQSLIASCWVLGGFLGTLSAMALLLWRLGILREAFYWSVLDHDVPHGPLSLVFWERALPRAFWFVAASAPLLWGSYRAAAHSGKYFAGLRAQHLALCCLLFVSGIGTAASGRFYPHYFIQMLPALCLLCAPVAAEIWHARTRPEGRRRWRVSAFYITGTALVFFGLHALAWSRTLQGGALTKYLQQHCAPNDRMFVWGQMPAYYAESRCRPASRYVATFPLTGYIFGSPLNEDPSFDTSNRIVRGSWETLERELTQRPPKFIVDVDGSAPAPRYPIGNYALLRRLLEEAYECVKRTPDGVIYRRIAADKSAQKQRAHGPA